MQQSHISWLAVLGLLGVVLVVAIATVVCHKFRKRKRQLERISKVTFNLCHLIYDTFFAAGDIPWLHPPMTNYHSCVYTLNWLATLHGWGAASNHCVDWRGCVVGQLYPHTICTHTPYVQCSHRELWMQHKRAEVFLVAFWE